MEKILYTSGYTLIRLLIGLNFLFLLFSSSQWPSWLAIFGI